MPTGKPACRPRPSARLDYHDSKTDTDTDYEDKVHRSHRRRVKSRPRYVPDRGARKLPVRPRKVVSRYQRYGSLCDTSADTSAQEDSDYGRTSKSAGAVKQTYSDWQSTDSEAAENERIERSMGVIRKKTAGRGTEGGTKYHCDVCSVDITSTVRFHPVVCFFHSLTHFLGPYILRRPSLSRI